MIRPWFARLAALLLFAPACGYDSGPLSDLGAAIDGARLPSGDGGGAPFLSPCQVDGDCASGVCGSYPAKGGRFCTQPCTLSTAAQDCPAPSPGCNNMGICWVP